LGLEDDMVVWKERWIFFEEGKMRDSTMNLTEK